VIPLPLESSKSNTKLKLVELEPRSTVPSKYYSIADYHSLYLSGELTPLAVAKAILPLVRRDTSPPGEHSMAWFDTKVDQVLKAAEESTRRYKEKRPLGPLDGVPTAVKDEFEIDGYTTCLGSRNDYTTKSCDDERITSWLVQKLEDAGAVIVGKLSMHEFGLGKLQWSFLSHLCHAIG
jgi:Asp-tRNA(Asn)/Glu-tRNA(Gln) amidotransferase A subunit family amidase